MKRTRNRIETSIGDDFIGAKFGPNNCIEVVAWCGERVGSNKKYTVFCSVCCNDPELFDLGLFLITKNKIRQGRIPCGCSKSFYSWSAEQYTVKILREIERKDFKYEFLGYAEEFKGSQTRIILKSFLGVSTSATVVNFLRGSHCKLHADYIGGIKNRKSDEHTIEKFMQTGAYSLGTTFIRSQVADFNGWFCNWEVKCGSCGEKYLGHLSNLSMGCVGCSCSQRRHNKSYIHTIYKDKEIVAIKFGITSFLIQKRLLEQSKRSGLVLEEFGLWEYPQVSLCRRAEQQVKLKFSNYLTREVFPDGFTETASYGDVEEIIKIFEINGGVRVR